VAESQPNGDPRRDSGRQEIKSIGGFELLARLGRGGMGAVYRARQTSMDREIALKILPPKLARDPSFVQRFQREARAAGKLSHPNIVAGIDVGEADGFHYFAMEYVEGETLTAFMKREGTLDEGRALKVATQIARALAHAHDHGLVHRDVKPQNVLLTPDGAAKLCDLGLARSTQDDLGLTLEGTALGTPHYISPEQVEGKRDIDGRTDLYALGAMLYHMLAGRPPFTAPTAAKVMTMHLTDSAPPLSEVAPAVSPDTAAVVMRLLEKERSARYASAGELVQDLELLAAKQAPVHLASVLERRRSTVRSRPVSQRVSAVLEAVSTGPRKGLVLALVVAGGLLVAGVIAAVLVLGGASGPTEKELAEAAAQKTWTGSVQPFVREKPTSEEANALLEALADFERAHGRTDFAADRAAETDRLRALAGAALVDEPPPAAGDAAEKELEELFAYALEWQRNHPEVFSDAIDRFKQVRARAKALKRPLWGLKAQDEIARLTKRRGEAADAIFKEVEAKVRALAGMRDYDGALAACVAPPVGELTKTLEPRVKVLAEEIRAAAEDAFKKAIEAAEASLAAGRPEEGLAGLKALEGARYAARAGEIVKLSDRLKKAVSDVAARQAEQRLAAARAAFEKVLDAFDTAVAGEIGEEAGAFAGARKVASRAARDEELAPVVDLAKDLGAVAEALPLSRRAEREARAALKGREVRFTPEGGREQTGTVEKVGRDELTVRVTFRISGQEMSTVRSISFSILSEDDRRKLREAWTPKTPAERVAAAVLALAQKEPGRAEALLVELPDHPLAARYARRVRTLRIGAAEASAEEAWAAFVKAVPPKIDKAAAERVRKLLDAFVAAHASTKFAKGKAAEIEALKTRLAVALEAKSYAGVWTKRAPTVTGADGKPFKFGRHFIDNGAAYDSKRKVCVLYGSGAFNNKRNDLWVYDPAKDAWRCLQAHDSDAKDQPPPHFPGGSTSLGFCYDEARDRYRLYADRYIWSYDPNARQWRKGPKYGPFVSRGQTLALGYHPGMKSVVTQHGFLDVATGKVEKLAKVPSGIYYSWRPSSVMVSGGFARPGENGCFLAFGGYKDHVRKTWAFDPSKPEWAKLEPRQSPPGRSHGNLIYHSGLKVWVLFGGRIQKDGKAAAILDTWVYAPHMKTWIEIKTPVSPSADGAIWYDAAHGQVVLFTRKYETWALKIKPSYEGAPTAPAPTPAPTPAPGDAAALQKRFKGKVERFDPATRRAKLVWNFAEEAQLEDFVRSTPRHLRFERDRIRMSCTAPECDTLRLPGFSGADVSIRLTYTLKKDLWGKNYLGAWFGAPTGRKLSTFALFANTEGFALADRGPIGHEKRSKQVPGRLPGKGSIEFGCRDGRTWIALDGKRVFEGTAPTGEPGAGVAVGGGFGILYDLERVEAEGALDRAWLGGEAAPAGAGDAAKVQKLFKGKVVRFDARTREIELRYDFENPDEIKDWYHTTDWRVENGRLVCKSAGESEAIWLNAAFRPGAVDLSFLGCGEHDLSGTLCGKRGGRRQSGYHAIFGGYGGKRDLLMGGREQANKSPSTFRRGRDHRLRFVKGKETLALYADGKLVLSAEVGNKNGNHVALCAFRNQTAYDEVTIKGVLDRAWLEERLKGAPPGEF